MVPLTILLLLTLVDTNFIINVKVKEGYNRLSPLIVVKKIESDG